MSEHVFKSSNREQHRVKITKLVQLETNCVRIADARQQLAHAEGSLLALLGGAHPARRRLSDLLSQIYKVQEELELELGSAYAACES